MNDHIPSLFTRTGTRWLFVKSDIMGLFPSHDLAKSLLLFWRLALALAFDTPLTPSSVKRAMIVLFEEDKQKVYIVIIKYVIILRR